MKKACSYAVEIPADTRHIGCSVKEILCFFQMHGVIEEDILFELKVILNELVINAVVHGNKEDKNKWVRIKAGMYAQDKVYIIVEDEGEDYSWSENTCYDVKGIQKEEVEWFCLNESGRGFVIISSLCDYVKRNKKGNRVMVIKKLR
ncbi:MAG: ATP-binding protein [Clostridiaceae bacterium]|nr:ATP-binding protein [Clostridiaceae bacterium]